MYFSRHVSSLFEVGSKGVYCHIITEPDEKELTFGEGVRQSVSIVQVGSEIAAEFWPFEWQFEHRAEGTYHTMNNRPRGGF